MSDENHSDGMISNNPQEDLYRHSKRYHWGLAILAWERDTKRGYQFEDGNLRIFKEGYYHLLEQVDAPLDRAQRVLARLNRALNRRVASRRRGMAFDELLSFEDQLEIFLLQFPEGFEGEAWTKKMRGVEGKKPLKRHRDPVIHKARPLLGKARLETLVASGQYDEVVDAAVDVLRSTSLARPALVKQLETMAAPARARFAAALLELLYGEEHHDAAFTSLTRALNAPAWELATALPALVLPTEQVCVHGPSFKRQALWMAPRLEPAKKADAVTYTRYLAMARAIFGKLEAAGLPPRDLLDVHDFIQLTMRPSARKLLEEARAELAAA